MYTTDNEKSYIRQLFIQFPGMGDAQGTKFIGNLLLYF